MKNGLENGTEITNELGARFVLVQLSPEEATMLREPIELGGGRQMLLRKVQLSLDLHARDWLTLEYDIACKLVDYAKGYVNGERFSKVELMVIKAIERSGWEHDPVTKKEPTKKKKDYDGPTLFDKDDE